MKREQKKGETHETSVIEDIVNHHRVHGEREIRVRRKIW
jgi:hypothetical protein